MVDMEFGAFLPRWDEYATLDGWRRVARAAEDAQFDWVGRGDRIAFPSDPDATDTDPRPAAELFSLLAYIANETEHVRIGTNVCVAPYRHPVHLVKEIFTLDVLSEGRFEFGVGAGWFEGDFNALEVPYETRGERTNEFLEIYDAARIHDVIEFDGDHYSFGPIDVAPRPVQRDGPPLWLGGSSSAAFRRTAQHDGVGWAISGRSPAEVDEGRQRLAAAWNDYDRAGDPLIAVNVNTYLSADHTDNEAAMIGNADDLLDGIEEYADAGTDRINLTLSTKPDGDRMNVDERVEQIERFRDEVMPSL